MSCNHVSLAVKNGPPITGKGLMSTYWIIVKGEGSVVSNTLTTSSTTSAEANVSPMVKTGSGETPNQDVDV